MILTGGCAVVELVEKSAFVGLVPIKVGSCRIFAAPPETMHLVSPYKGQEKALSEAMKKAHGMAFPAAERATGKEGARCVWFGLDQAMLIGPAPDARLSDFAAVVDQSDGWAVLRLQGPKAEEVLARLVPVDMRAAHFKRGQTARTQLRHLQVSITRIGAMVFQIMVMRSMAKTLVDDLEGAMRLVAAR
ncbi:sarcosine oxidase subunit gamma [Profundibacter sp.]|uniref:sarcosine oxidase subunit gamma n=1 Tax=Profundibacter sp. TaxID=3101071 RepID=UPI003D1430D1